MIQRNMQDKDNLIFGIRQYVAIVPFRTGFGYSNEIKSLINVSVLFIWVVSAAIFAMLRLCYRLVLDITDNDDDYLARYQQPRSTTFFNSFAGVLGNSAGLDRLYSGSETFLVFVVGVFAVLTSMLFTGFIFEQLVGIERLPQIDTIRELFATNMPIRECLIDNNAERRPWSPYLQEHVTFISVGAIEKAMLIHDTSTAFVLPEPIADIVHHPSMQYRNGTPVYHIVAEPYNIAPQCIYFIPNYLHNTLFALWDRLMESGITIYHERSTIATYKMVRSEWLDSVRRTEDENVDQNDEGLSSDLSLLLFVLGLGFSAAGFVFLLEILWNTFSSRKLK